MTYHLLILLCAALFATITWRYVRHGLFLLSAALPTYLLRFSVASVPFTLLECLLLIFVGVWLAKNFRSLTRQDTRLDGWTVPIVLLLVAATIGVIVAPDRLAALGIWKAYFVEPVLLFFVVRIENSKRQDAKTQEEIGNNVLTGLATGALFVAACAIVQKFTGWGLPAPWDVEGRVTSVFPYPNAVGLYLGPVIVMGVAECWSGGVLEWRKNIHWSITSIVSVVAIVFSQSEAAWVAVTATLFVAALLNARWRKVAVAIVAGATLLIAVSPLRQTVIDKLAFHDYSGRVRRSQWEETVNMLKDHAVFGAGLSGYPTALVPYHTHLEYEIFQYPHQIFLNVWTELGLLGLVAFVLLGVQVVRGVTPSLRHSNTPSLHHSTTPPLQHSTTPPPRHSSFPSPFSKWPFMAWPTFPTLKMTSRS